jgi:methyl-accepting chemotaxis protein
MSIGNLKIGTRLGLGFAVVLALMLGLIFVALTRMQDIQENLEHIVKDSNVKLALVGEMRKTVLIRAIAVRNVVLLTDKADMDKEAQRIYDQRKIYTDAVEKLASMVKSDKGKALLARTAELAAATKGPVDRAMELGLQNKTTEATALLIKEVRPSQRKWLDALDELTAFQQSKIDEDAADAVAAFNGARTMMFLFGGVAIVLGIVVAFLISRSVTRPISQAAGVAARIAAGDLTSNVESRGKDETGQLLESMKTMNSKLSEIVAGINETSSSVATGAREISAGNTNLSQRTEEQASSLEETASSMEELTSTVKQNADNAKQANQLAVAAREQAEKGGEVVSKAVGAMSEINAASKKIADIIGVIDEIAFQTNLLALNAAVEAARAGEQGRGFAVVAGEVRNLAQRSAASAKEIKDLIGDSVQKVDDGARLVDQSGATLAEIVNAVKKVSDIVAEIAAASQEQSAGIEQVNKAVMQMDEMTQQNAALVEEAAAASKSMEEQAHNMNELMRFFTVAQGHTRNTVASKPVVHAAAVNPSSHGAGHGPAPAARTRPVARPAPAKPAGASRAPAAGADGEWEEF